MISRGSTPDTKSLGSGREERKLLLEEGVVDEDVKSLL